MSSKKNKQQQQKQNKKTVELMSMLSVPFFKFIRLCTCHVLLIKVSQNVDQNDTNFQAIP